MGQLLIRTVTITDVKWRGQWPANREQARGSPEDDPLIKALETQTGRQWRTWTSVPFFNVIYDSGESIDAMFGDRAYADNRGDQNFGELLRWYVEDFGTKHPYFKSRAVQATESMEEYADHLMDLLHLSNLFTEPLQAPQPFHLVIEIENSAKSGATFRAAHWEVLENNDSWASWRRKHPKIPVRSVSVIHTVGDVKSPPPTDPVNQSTEGFNILAVTARPRFENDISHRTIMQPLFSIVSTMNETRKPRIDLHMARPGTYESLIKCLQHKPYGYWRVLHIDVHGTTKDGAYLLFIKPTPEGYQEHRISSSTFACDVSKHGVEIVVLNSCQSAADSDSDQDLNIARALVCNGISTVIAMRCKVLEHSAKLFVEELYRSLVQHDAPSWLAVHRARQRLKQEGGKKMTSLGLEVHVADYFVPVIYQSQQAYKQAFKQQSYQCAVFSHETSGSSTDSYNYSEVGMDGKILLIETDLLLLSPVLQLYGAAGIGKRSLINAACSWWKSTGFINDYSLIDMSSNEGIQDFLAMDPGKASRNLVVLLGLPEGLSTPQRRAVKTAIKRTKANSFVISVTRKLVTWLQLIVPRATFVPALTGADVMQLGISLIKASGKVLSLEDPDTREHASRLFGLSCGNPLALRVLIEDFNDRSMDLEQYFRYLLEGGGIVINPAWVEQTRGTRFLKESQETVRRIESMFEAWMTPRVLLPFWNVIPVEELVAYWLLVQKDMVTKPYFGPQQAFPSFCWSDSMRLRSGRVHAKEAMEYFEAAKVDFRGYNYKPEPSSMVLADDARMVEAGSLDLDHDPLDPNVKSKINEVITALGSDLVEETIQEAIEGVWEDEKILVRSYLKMHPLLPFILRNSHSDKFSEIQRMCRRVVPRYYHSYVKSWNIDALKESLQCQGYRTVIRTEELNFLAGAYYTLYRSFDFVTMVLIWRLTVLLHSTLADEDTRPDNLCDYLFTTREHLQTAVQHFKIRYQQGSITRYCSPTSKDMAAYACVVFFRAVPGLDLHPELFANVQLALMEYIQVHCSAGLGEICRKYRLRDVRSHRDAALNVWQSRFIIPDLQTEAHDDPETKYCKLILGRLSKRTESMIDCERNFDRLESMTTDQGFSLNVILRNQNKPPFIVEAHKLFSEQRFESSITLLLNGLVNELACGKDETTLAWIHGQLCENLVAIDDLDGALLHENKSIEYGGGGLSQHERDRRAKQLRELMFKKAQRNLEPGGTGLSRGFAYNSGGMIDAYQGIVLTAARDGG